ASDPTGELAPWSAGLGALRFVVAEGVVYWIPANPAADRLAFLEETSLSSYLDPAQLADLWLEEGNRLRSANEFEAAIPAYQQVIALRPHDAEAFAGLGAAYLGLGRTEEAVQTLQRAVELDPDHYWAHRLLGNAYLKLQRFALAADELTQAYILDPRDPHLLLGIALGQGRSGQRDLALLSLDQLLARTQDDRLRADAEVLWREFSANPP
ncbi:MAG: tetratricopeptide repeat protein, partial [Chloroflexi bacterium]